MSEKDFTDWHQIKNIIDKEKERPYFHEREIWFCGLGSNIGFEQDGKGKDYLRPVVIIKKFNNDVCLVIPLTTTQKKGIHYFSFVMNGAVLNTAILSQIRLIDSKRLHYKKDTMIEKDFYLLKQKLIRLLA